MKYFRVSSTLLSPQSLINNTPSGVSHRMVPTSVVGRLGVVSGSSRLWGLEGKGCVRVRELGVGLGWEERACGKVNKY